MRKWVFIGLTALAAINILARGKTETTTKGISPPVPGYKATRKFGLIPSAFDTSQIAKHTGVDIPAPLGTRVNSIMDGTVVDVVDYDDGNACGIRVQIKHPSINGLWSVYCHLSAIDPVIHKGVAVRSGQKIGEVGWSGNVSPKDESGSHLHFGIYDPQTGQFVDPSLYMGE